LRGQPDLTTRVPQGFQPSWQDEAGSRPPRFEPADHRDDRDLADPGFETRGYPQAPDYQAPDYQAPGYPQVPDYQAPAPEPKRRSGRKKDPAAKGRSVDPTPTLVDQPRLQDTPVYQTGMQLVVPAGQEWTFRDPGTGAFPGVRQDQFGGQAQQDRFGGQNQQDRFGGQAQQDQFGDQTQQDSNGRGGPSGRSGPAAFPPPAPPGPRGQWADRPPAPQPGAGPDPMLPAPAGRRRGRRAPLFIGIGAAVVVIGVGAAVAAPRLLKHTDPGCSAYTTSALPTYNQTITDLNAQASQATLASDLTAAIAQLSAAAGQAQGAPVKSALQGLLTQMTQVQADTQKGSVPAATVTQLNTAADAADNACGSS
jgi:hypothetical protein